MIIGPTGGAMNKRRKLVLAAVAAVAVIGVGTGAGVAAGSGDDVPLEGSEHDQATAAALESVGPGFVVDTEVGDDGEAYAVDVRLDDGSQLEVQLNSDFEVTGSEPDDVKEPDDTDEPDDTNEPDDEGPNDTD
jgi:hypothetical protein